MFDVIPILSRFTSTLVYWGLSLNAGSFGDVYLNTFLAGAIEVPALIVCLLCLQYLGRRAPNAIAMLLAGVFCLSIVPVLLIDPGKWTILVDISAGVEGIERFDFEWRNSLYFYGVFLVALSFGSLSAV